MIYLLLFTTGFAALGLETIWQRNLSYLIGSDALAFSYAIGIFVSGLGLGSLYSSSDILKFSKNWPAFKKFGFLEILIAIINTLAVLSFTLIYKSSSFPLITKVSFFSILILGFTFCMGASFTILAKYLIEKEQTALTLRLYAINCLGAFLGVTVSGLYLIYILGLQATALIYSAFYLISGLYFYLKKNEETVVALKKKTKMEVLGFTTNQNYLLAFLSGCIYLGLESILFRYLNLTLGPYYYSFPLILASALLPMALGAFFWNSPLQLKRSQILLAPAILFIVLLYFLLPYWPQWAVALRDQFTESKHDLFFYLCSLFIFLCVFTWPLYLPLSRIFPMVLIDRETSQKNHIHRIYALNIFGGLFGSIGIGGFGFLLYDLPHALKLITLLMLICFLILVKISISRKLALGFVSLLLIYLIPMQNRVSHWKSVSMGKIATNWELPKFENKEQLLWAKDGVHHSVAILSGTSPGMEFKALSIDSKPDGNTLSDLATMLELGIIPYLTAPGKSDLNVAVVGLGTGISAGILAQGQDVRNLKVLELSAEVVESSKLFSVENYDLHRNPKVEILAKDALPYFNNQRQRNAFDVIIAEPSNPWVTGNENLFTEDIFESYSHALGDDGVLVQWMHTYSSSFKIFLTILRNINKSFPSVEVYGLGSGDLVFIAKKNPLDPMALNPQRFSENAIRSAAKSVGWKEVNYLKLALILPSSAISKVLQNTRPTVHSLQNPTLAFWGAQAKFEKINLHPREILSPLFSRLYLSTVDLQDQFKLFMSDSEAKELCKNNPAARINFLCQRTYLLMDLLHTYESKTKDPIDRLVAYTQLRTEGVIAANIDFTDSMFYFFKSDPLKNLAAAKLLIEEFVKDKNTAALNNLMNELTQNPNVPKIFKDQASRWITEQQGILSHW